MAIEASFAEELSRFHCPDNCFLALIRGNDNLVPSFLDVEDRIGGVFLRDRVAGRIAAFPEVDRAAWFDLDTARCKILSGQTELLDRLEKGLA